MTDTCEYAIGPEGDGGRRSGSSLDSVWECPHPTYLDTDYCVFHLPVESRELLGVTEMDVCDAFVRSLEEMEPGEPCRFIGAHFGETVIEADTLGRATDTIDLRETKFDGVFDLRGTTVGADLVLDSSDLQRLDAPNVVFEGDVSFCGCRFEGRANLDGSTFEGDASFENATFELNAEFSDAVFEGDVDFRRSVHKGVQTLFKNAEFRRNVRMSSVTFDKVEFTGSEFDSTTDFTDTTFNDKTEIQYTKFNGNVDFGKADFNGNSSFRGSYFAAYANFNNASFQGWTSFLNVEFNRDVSFESAWFKSEINMIAESENNAVINFTGARMGKASFEVEPYKPVVLDFTRARVGNVRLSVEGKVNNPLDNVRFVETQFNGFRFSEYADYFAEKDYVIHDSVVKKEDEVSPAGLEKTYRLASEDAKGEADDIASKFAKKEAKYRRQRYRQEGDTLSYYTDLVRGYGVYIVLLVLLVGAAVVGFVLFDGIRSLVSV